MTKPKVKQTGTGRRPRYSRAEGVALVQRWRSSGLSAQAFSEQHDVPVSRLWYWFPIAKKAAAEESAKANSDFHVVTVPADMSTAQRPPSELGVRSSALSQAVIVVVPTTALGESLRSILGGLEA